MPVREARRVGRGLEMEKVMSTAIAEFVSKQPGDSAEFIGKVRALAVGVAQDFAPWRLYVIRIDNWFGPRWMHFAGKFTIPAAGKLHAISVGIHKKRLHVPPFVPSRVVEQRVFEGSKYEQKAEAEPLHIEIPSKLALQRRIADIDKDAAFLWFSGESEGQKRGSVMVYLPVTFNHRESRPIKLGSSGAFYVGFLNNEKSWEPAMLRGISRGEVAHLEESDHELRVA